MRAASSRSRRPSPDQPPLLGKYLSEFSAITQSSRFPPSRTLSATSLKWVPGPRLAEMNRSKVPPPKSPHQTDLSESAGAALRRAGFVIQPDVAGQSERDAEAVCTAVHHAPQGFLVACNLSA